MIKQIAIICLLALLLVGAHSKKRRWPECVGQTATWCKERVLSSYPAANVSVLPDGSPESKDLRENRVRIFVNANQVVTRAPYMG